MTMKTKTTEKKKLTFKGRFAVICAVAAGAVILLSALVYPLLEIFNTDIAYMTSPLPTVFTVAGHLIDWISDGILAALLCCSVFLLAKNKKRAAPFLAVSAALVISKPFVNLLFSGIINGFSSVTKSDLADSFLYLGINSIAYVIASAFAWFGSEKFLADASAREKAYNRLGTPESERKPSELIFKKVLDRNNPVSSGIFIAVFSLLALTVIYNVILFEIPAGLPGSGAEWFSIFLHYFEFIIDAAAAYLLGFLSAKFLDPDAG